MPPPKDPIKAEEWKQRQKVAQIGKSRNIGVDNPFYGKKHSPKTIEILRKAGLGRKQSDETKEKIRLSHLGKPNPNKGKKLEEIVGVERAIKIKENMSLIAKRRPPLVKTRLGIPQSAETKKLISIINRQRTRKGKDHPRWKGGVTARYIDIFNGIGYRAWRRDVFERDNYTCQKCTDRKGHNLEAHHIVSVKDAFETDRIELIYDVSNGITLCKECHKGEHKHVKIKD